MNIACMATSQHSSRATLCLPERGLSLDDLCGQWACSRLQGCLHMLGQGDGQ